MPRRTRSIFPAPKFWPTKVVTEMPKAFRIIQWNPSIRPQALQAAVTSVPKPLMKDWISTLLTEYITLWSPAGRPILTILRMRSGWKRIILTLRQHTDPDLTSTITTRAALTVWLRMVARAAPATPIFSVTTKSRSSRILLRHAAPRKYMGRRESPTALSRPEPTL